MYYLRTLGPLVLDHRFRRMMDALLRTAEAIYEARGLRFRARWTSTYLLLSESGPLGVMDIADGIGLTHPAVITILEEMAAASVIRSVADRTDRRRRQVALSRRGRELKPELVRVWEELAAAQAGRFMAEGCDIVAVLNGVEDGLVERSLTAEVLERLETRESVPLPKKRLRRQC
jgi:DNA-binding MarR family transcriptional regulator